jgi:two-component system, NarL family, sensor kinase
MLTIFLLSISLLFVCLLLILIWFYGRRRNSIASQEAINRGLHQTYLQSMLEIREQTIKDTRQVLHNNMGQMASLVKLCLNNLPLQDAEKTTIKIEETREITQQLINDIKSLSLTLSDEHLAHSDLDKSLEAEVAGLNKSSRLHVNFSIEGRIPVLDKLRTVILFRLSQEIINYRIKQGKAKHLSILLHGLENVLILSFSDERLVLADEVAPEYAGGFLPGLDKKAKQINARIFVESISTGKNDIRIEMPL